MSIPSAHILGSNISINTLLQMSNIDTHQLESKASIFKGISTFENHQLEPTISMTALNTVEKSAKHGVEKMDLTELVLQEQMLYMPNSATSSNSKELSQMQPVTFDHRTTVIPLDMIDQIKQDINHSNNKSKSRSTGTSENDDDDEDDDDSSQMDSSLNDSTYDGQENFKSTAKANKTSTPVTTRRGRKPLSLKRLETPAMPVATTSSGEKRGRKPGSNNNSHAITAATMANANSKKTKKQLLLD
jgi:ABC-type antimicrobial peptide transport system permease subunit